MRALTPTPPQQRRQVPVADTDTSSPTPSLSDSQTCLTRPTSPDPTTLSELVTESSTEETQLLKEEISRLNVEVQRLLDHTIENDTRLLQFTDNIFATSADTSSVLDQPSRTPSAVDRAVQCDLMENLTSADFAVQVDLTEPSRVTRDGPGENDTSLINSLRTTIEVLEAENECLKLQLKTCDCGGQRSSHPWTEVQNKKQKNTITTYNRFGIFQRESDPPTECTRITNRSVSKKSTLLKQNNTKKWQKKELRRTLPFEHVNILGDSHTRHLAGLVKSLSDTVTTVSGFCKPGARLLDIVSLKQRSQPPEPGPRCEVLFAGTNDVANGTQHNIYRHLETYISNRPEDTEVIVATLPLRHDLEKHHPIHEETVLVNAFISELAARHNVQVLNVDFISRKYFTKHGQHLSMRGKRFLAEMLVRSISLVGTRLTPPSLRSSAEELPSTITRPGNKSFAEAVATCSSALSSPSVKIHNFSFLGTPLTSNGQN